MHDHPCGQGKTDILHQSRPRARRRSLATRLVLACAAALAAVAFIVLLTIGAAQDAEAQRGGGFGRGSFGGGFSRGGFNRGGGSFGRQSFGTRRMMQPRGAGMRPPRVARTPRVNRVTRTRPNLAHTRIGRSRIGRTSGGSRVGTRRPGKRQASKYPDKKPPSGCRGRKCGPTEGGSAHKRAGSEGGHRRVASAGHNRRLSQGGGQGHNRRISYGGGEGHKRAGSYGDGHKRAGSYGDGHRRVASAGHNRRISYGGGDGHRRRLSVVHRRFGSYGGPGPTVFTPPVPPPPPPPTAGGGGSQPPRSTTGGPTSQPPQQATRGFPSGGPPAGENRYVPDQVIVVLRDDLTEAEIDQFLAQNGLARTAGGDVRIGLIGVRVFRFRITDGRSVPQVIAALQNDPRGVSVQPNYIYQLAEMPVRERARPMVRTATGGMRPATGANHSMQYVITKLRLREAHEVTQGERVLVAVIDSGVDADHPELDGTIVKQIDVTEDSDKRPHRHGTAMTGIIVAQSDLMGVAPAARIVAIRAFSPRSRTGASGTSFHIALAIDRAVQEGARIINLSLAGPDDPYVLKAIEEAHARGVILVAAAGNNGPNSPPAYPAAYPQVIAVTATDSRDQVYRDANRGNYITIAAPGVQVIVVVPGGAVGITDGTSVAAAHITGIIALMLSRNPSLDPDTAREFLIRSARAAAAAANGEYGAGHADAYAAVMIVGPPPAQPPVAAGGQPPPTQ